MVRTLRLHTPVWTCPIGCSCVVCALTRPASAFEPVGGAVHRICNQLGWVGKGGTKQPEQTRKAIESWMPRDVWPEVNLVLVGLGQEVQTEKAKLLRKCLACSDPPRALQLAKVLGIDVKKEAAKADLVLPP